MRDAILDAAKTVFFAHGYQLASMDNIATEAGTTKRTVYSYFSSKEELFLAVVRRGCAHVLASLPAIEDLPQDPRLALPRYLKRVRDLICSENCVRLERLVMAEVERQPRAGEALAGAFREGEARLARYLAARKTDGRIAGWDKAALHVLMSVSAYAPTFCALLRERRRRIDDAAIDRAVENFFETEP